MIPIAASNRVGDAEDERGRVLDVVEPVLDPAHEVVLDVRGVDGVRGLELIGIDVLHANQLRDRHDRRDRAEGDQRVPAGAPLPLIGELAPRRVGSIRDRGRGAVQRDGHDHDGDAGEQREGRVRVEPVRDDVAESLPADQTGDHDERQREHDRLVEGEEELATRQGELDLEEGLPGGGAERLRSLDRLGGDAADAERGDPNSGRDRVDQRADHSGRGTHREHDHDGHEVGEGGHDLHCIEHRGDCAVDPLVAARPDPEWHADQNREKHRGSH